MTNPERRLVRALKADYGPDIPSLLAGLSDWLTFHSEPDLELAMCVCWNDGTADVWAPKDNAPVILHELAHALRGSARMLLAAGQVEDGDEEEECDSFADVFRDL